jgi:hypothetical protein
MKYLKMEQCHFVPCSHADVVSAIERSYQPQMRQTMRRKLHEGASIADEYGVLYRRAHRPYGWEYA